MSRSGVRGGCAGAAVDVDDDDDDDDVVAARGCGRGKRDVPKTTNDGQSPL